MRTTKVIFLAVVLGTMTACTTPESSTRASPEESPPACPVSVVNQEASPYRGEVGEGPVYAAMLAQIQLPSEPDSSVRRLGGYYFNKVLWVAKDEKTFGRVVVDGGSEVRFGRGAHPSDRLVLKRRAGFGVDPSEPDWLNWPSYVRIAGPGCYRLQLTGPGIDQEIVFEVTPQ